jgi:hypothetical protein
MATRDQVSITYSEHEPYIQLTMGYHRTHIRKWCWIFTRSGKPNSFLAFDLGQEHNVRDIKVNYRSSGPGATIEYTGRISPGIPTFNRVCRSIENQIGSASRKAKHGSPDKTADVQELLSHYTTNGIHIYRPGRRSLGENASKDVITLGAMNAEKKAEEWFNRRTLTRSTEEDWTDMKPL